jgi:hypothetical protein
MTITGAVVSTTVTLNVVEVAAFPAASVALQITPVVPRENVEPEVGKQVTVGLGLLSVAVGLVYVTGAPDGDVASTFVISDPVAKTGASLSIFVIVIVEVEITPLLLATNENVPFEVNI